VENPQQISEMPALTPLEVRGGFTLKTLFFSFILVKNTLEKSKTSPAKELKWRTSNGVDTPFCF